MEKMKLEEFLEWKGKFQRGTMAIFGATAYEKGLYKITVKATFSNEGDIVFYGRLDYIEHYSVSVVSKTNFCVGDEIFERFQKLIKDMRNKFFSLYRRRVYTSADFAADSDDFLKIFDFTDERLETDCTADIFCVDFYD